MNANAEIDQFQFWRDALAQKRGVETERGNPRSGYYRVKNEAIAFWRDDDGVLSCWRSGTFPAPTDPDLIDELFGWCAPHPVAYLAFTDFRVNGRWPEQLEPTAPTTVELPPHEALDRELTTLREQAKAWVAAIGSVKTKEDADKSANYADAFAKLEKRAGEAHKAEKAPHLEAGRAVDAAWKPLIERAGECKTWAKKAAEAFLIAEKRRLDEEERQRAEKARRIEQEAMKARVEAARIGAPPPVIEAPPIAPPPVKAKAGTSGRVISLRTRTVNEITDLRAFLTYLASANDLPEDFIEAVRKLANRMVAAGMKPPGVETKTIEEVA